MRPSTIKMQVSSGGVVYKKQQGRPAEVALVAVKGGNIWTLPKGIVGGNESFEQTALREVAEETGLKAELVGKLGDISYWYFIREENSKCKKTVHFYLMKYLEGSTDDHDFEVDAAAWFPVEEALKKVTYKGDAEMLRKARDVLREKGLL
jgi:8-oxo-dGTP pyrophosphatase MutT (NUDIX family)